MMTIIRLSISGLIVFFSQSLMAGTHFETTDLASMASFLSDDGSEIRSLPTVNGVETVHCRLPQGGVIHASRHKTVAQLWYVLSGNGDLWLEGSDGKESIISLKNGVSVTVPLGYKFQFRNTGTQNLDILIVNTTKWSGPGELIPVKNRWRLPKTVLNK